MHIGKINIFKMRDIKTLLRIIIDNVDYYQKKNNGMCGWVNQSYLENHISLGERMRLHDFIKSQKPTWIKHIAFYYDKDYLPNFWNKFHASHSLFINSYYHEGYWWKIPLSQYGESGRNDKRIKFLNYLFNKI